MTQQQRNAITTPANGLLVYQTDQSAGFYFYDQHQWKKLAGSSEVQAGTPGSNGNTILSGNAMPQNATGNNGDFYLHTATATLYGPKANNVWPSTGINLTGPQGETGPTGTFSGTLSGDITGTASDTKIANDAVATQKIRDGAVTNDKIATGIHASKVGLGNVNNTSDADKPLSTATTNALAQKENTANKAIDLTDPDHTKYPTTKTVVDALMVAYSVYNGGLIMKETSENKVTDLNEPDHTKFPTTKAVADALDVKENMANKATNLANADDTKYPTTKAVADAITSAATTSASAMAQKENTANKATNLTDADDTKFPTTKAVADAITSAATTSASAMAQKENTANKATNLTDADDIKFPTTKTVADAISSTSGNLWSKQGNAGTTNADFIGTTDNRPLSIKVNNQNAGHISNISRSIFLGYLAGKDYNSNRNTGFGYSVLSQNTTGEYNTAVGESALASNTNGVLNTAMGAGALLSNSSGKGNNAYGNDAMRMNDSGAYNSAFGMGALRSNTNGVDNTAVGGGALSNNTSGKGNIGIGGGANVTSGGLSNATVIGHLATVDASNKVQIGNNDVTAVKLGGTAAVLETAQIKLTSGSPGAGKVLTSDANGLASWSAPAVTIADLGNKENTANKATDLTDADNTKFPTTKAVSDALASAAANVWSKQGNAGTTDTDFIGTTDNKPLLFKIDNEKAGQITNTSRNTFLGYHAGKDTNSGKNTGFGYLALGKNASGEENAAHGADALAANTAGSWNTALGTRSLGSNLTGHNNTANGRDALSANTSGHYNTGIGTASLSSNTTGNENTGIGPGALSSNTSGNGNTAVGMMANVAFGNLSNATAIGYTAIVNASNKVQIGNEDITAVKLGGSSAVLETAQIKLTGGSPGPNKVLTSDAAGLASWTTPTVTSTDLGNKENTANKVTDLTNADDTKFPTTKAVADAIITATASSWSKQGNAGTTNADFIGTTDNRPLLIKVNNEKAGKIEQSTSGNTFWGYMAGNSTTSVRNTASGYQALLSNINGAWNTANGYSALSSNISGSINTAVGYAALASNTTGTQNNAIGASTLLTNTTGSNNTALGNDALSNNTIGSKNTALGGSANVSYGATENATAIGYGAMVNASNKVQIGNSDVTAVKFGGTNAVLETAHIKLTGGSPGANKVLTSDANGLASWTTPTVTPTALADAITTATATVWSKQGNAGTTNADFIGTTDNRPLLFKANNRNAGKIEVSSSNASTFWGYMAGEANYARNNTGIGYGSLFKNTAGIFNTATGTYSLSSNTSGDGNTANGNSTLQNNTEGWGNSATGNYALNMNVSGGSNTANGSYALLLNSTGNYNTAIGHLALSKNQTGSNNTGIGTLADVTSNDLSNATAIGHNALVDASNKVQIGDTFVTSVKLGGTAVVLETAQIKLTGGSPGANKVLTSDVNGLATWATPQASGWGLTGNSIATDGSAFIGTTNNQPLIIKANNQKAGKIDITDALANTFWGYQSGNATTVGKYNTANGYKALAANTGGVHNTATGYNALAFSTGTGNTAIGSEAMLLNNGGIYNTSIGSGSLSANVSGYYNTAIGFNADVAESNLTNATAIGYNAKVDASNKVRIGNGNVTIIQGQVAFTNASDQRFKTAITPMDKGLDFIQRLKPVSYQMKNSSDKRINWGFIAQDIEALVGTENAVLTIGNDAERSLGLRYTDFISPMVKAMQELAQKNMQLDQENQQLKQQLLAMQQKESEFSARLEKIEQMLDKGQQQATTEEKKK
ncbi:MAG: tail fiber domain-containing protein [Pedobacter sp.]|uniref:tail fiber domain-containing protein n=1 Tax=Pedobacter sp. TaxID=1411316 RepID=UPI0028091CD6|nr:tail fiber domain-containing protein [Pedobacter sp.]MDQ8003466.1 tail fiber domain-containing protein [Pedobacter sp.]